MTNQIDITVPWDDPSWFDEDEIEESANTTEINSQKMGKTNNGKEEHLSVIDEYSETSESISNQIDEQLMSIKNNCPTSAKFIAAQNSANDYQNQRNFYNRQYQPDYNYQPNRNNGSPNNYKSRNNGHYNSNRNYKQNASNNEYYENRDSFLEKPNNYNNKNNSGYKNNTTSFKRQMERDSYRNYQSNDEERYPKHNSMNLHSNNIGANSITTKIQKSVDGKNEESSFGDRNQQIKALNPNSSPENTNITGTKSDSFDEGYKRSSEKKVTTEANSTLTAEIDQVKISQTKLEENSDIKPETPKRHPIEIYNVNSVKGKWSSLFNENKDKSPLEHQLPLNVPEADQQGSNSNFTNKEDHPINELENPKYNKNDISNPDYQNSLQYNRKLRNTGQIKDQNFKNKNHTRVNPYINYEHEPQYANGKTMASQPETIINKAVEYNSTGKNNANNHEFSDYSRFQSTYNDTDNDPRRYINDRKYPSAYDLKGTRKPNFNRNGNDSQNYSFKNESMSLRGDRYNNMVNDDLKNPNSVERNTKEDSRRLPHQQVHLENDISGYERKNVNMDRDQNDKVDVNEDRKGHTKGNNYKRNQNCKSKRTNNDYVKYEGEKDHLETCDQRQDNETILERNDSRVAPTEGTISPNNKGNNYKRNQNWKYKRTNNDSVKSEGEKYDLKTNHLRQNSDILDESNDSPNYRNSYRRNPNWKNKRPNNNCVKSETEKEELEINDLRPNSETVEESGNLKIAPNERIDSPNNLTKRYPNDRNNFNNTEFRRKQTWINSRNQKNEKWGVTKDDRSEIENDLKSTQNEINEQGNFQSRRNQNWEENRANDKFDSINGYSRNNMFNDDYRRFMAEKDDTNYNWRDKPPKERSGKDVNESFQETGGNFVNVDSRKHNRNKSKSVESDYLRFKTGREGSDVKKLSDQSNDRISDNKTYRHGINNEEFTKIEGECIYYTQNSKGRRFGNENNSNFERSNSFNGETGTKSKFLTEDEILANQGFIRPDSSYRDRNSPNVSQRNNRNFPNSPSKFPGPNNHPETRTAPYQDKPKSYQNSHYNRSSQNQRSFDGDYRSKNIKNDGNI